MRWPVESGHWSESTWSEDHAVDLAWDIRSPGTAAGAVEDSRVGHWSADSQLEVDRTRSGDSDCRSPGRRVASEDRRRTAEDIGLVDRSGVVMLERSVAPDSCPAADRPEDLAEDQR